MKSFHELAAEVAMGKLKSSLAKEAKKAAVRAEDIAEEHGCSCNDGGECKCDADADCCDCNETNEAVVKEYGGKYTTRAAYLKPDPYKGEATGDKFVPHMMYDPKTGKSYKAEKEADHLRMKKMGYSHDKKAMVRQQPEANEDVKVKSSDKKAELINVDGKLVTRMTPTTKRQADKKDEVEEGKKPGLWANMHARRKAGKPKLKPGDKNYPKTLDIESKEESANLKLINRIKNSGVVKTGSMSKDGDGVNIVKDRQFKGKAMKKEPDSGKGITFKKETTDAQAPTMAKLDKPKLTTKDTNTMGKIAAMMSREKALKAKAAAK